MKFINVNDIKQVVTNKAKYQKVMMLLDEYSNTELAQHIQEEIKDICVFNKCYINKLDDEIINGYRLIIYLISANNYLICNVKKDEYINVIVAQDNLMLPYMLDNNLKKIDNYIVAEQHKLDLHMLSSIYLNAFFNYFHNLTLGQQSSEYFNLLKEEITQQNLYNVVEGLDKEFFFLDMDIIKKSNAKAENTAVLDLIIINAFIVLINQIKTQSLTLVDVYKTAGENTQLIEKFYRLHFNANFHQLVILNYNCLINFANKTKEKILEIVSFLSVDRATVNRLMIDLKNYSTLDAGLCGYLYLYNMFEDK